MSKGLLFLLAAYLTLLICFVYWPLDGRRHYEHEAEPMVREMRGTVRVERDFKANPLEQKRFNPMTGEYEFNGKQ